jgi:hypothetical protein
MVLVGGGDGAAEGWVSLGIDKFLGVRVSEACGVVLIEEIAPPSV